MAFETFRNINFRPATRLVIDQANVIIDEYQQAGFTLTLRQLYYQFVSRGLIPNKQTEYDKLGAIVNDGRLAGEIDWDAIEDRTRRLREYAVQDSPAAAARDLAKESIEDLWDAQPKRIEVWIEKDALLGVIEPVCGRWRIPHFACRGYASQSELYIAGKRLAEYVDREQEVLILHLGDHDPSGIDMTRDNRERLHLFAGGGNNGFDVDEPDERYENAIEIRRIALNMNQVQQYNPPPNPAKLTDSRATDYISRFGNSSWELDALDPKVIDQLIDAEVRGEIDPQRWATARATEKANRQKLLDAADEMEDDA